MQNEKEVNFLIRDDGLYLSYLQDPKDKNIWIWDEYYRDEKDFNILL